MNNELITIGLKSCNQSRYQRDAVEGVLAQTYRPLQIIISDDFSTDGSWQWFKERFGIPAEDESAHFVLNPEAGLEIVLHRNEKNLGNLGNWEVICSLTKGELIVKADGDDVSTPDRVARTVEAWRKNGKKALAVCHSGWQIDRNGRLFCVTAYLNFALLMPKPIGDGLLFGYVLFRNVYWKLQRPIVKYTEYTKREAV